MHRPLARLILVSFLGLALGAPCTTLANANPLLYFGLLGGSSLDQVHAIQTDAEGSIYLLGTTYSADFPVANAQQEELAGDSDLFLAKLDASGMSLLFATYLGGSGSETGNSLVIDGAGDLWVTGATTSADFPVTKGALDPYCGSDGECDGGAADAFLAGFHPDGQQFYGSYWGGSGEDRGDALAVDTAGHLLLAGTTSSPDLVLLRPTQKGFGGDTDAMVAELSFATFRRGSRQPMAELLFSTYLGGSGAERVTGAAITSKDLLAIVGSTSSPDLPLVHPLQRYGIRGATDALLAAWYVPDGRLLISANLGGGLADRAESVAASGSEIVLAGRTTSPDFPVRAAIDSALSGKSDTFLTKVDFGRLAIEFSTFHGGDGDESSATVAVGASGEILLAGATNSRSSLPLTPDAEQSFFGGGDTDIFVGRYLADGSSLAYGTYLGSTLSETPSSQVTIPTGGWLQTGSMDLGTEGLPSWDTYFALLGGPSK